jgi:hypothetical protein
MTTTGRLDRRLPPIPAAEKKPFIVLAIAAGILCLLGVVASSVITPFLATCATAQECIDATEALLGPTLALVIGPFVLFLIGGIAAIVVRWRRNRGIPIPLAITVVAQVLWIIGWCVALVTGF